MEKRGKKLFCMGIVLLIAFILWTILVQAVDVRAVGPEGSKVGFSTWNVSFHQFTGVHMTVYTITDWLGLLPVFVCMVFGIMGFCQLVKRKSLLKVDLDILLLGMYYIVVIAAYLIFEMIPINYRPILINGILETSYPSSTALLVLSVMPTLRFQLGKRMINNPLKRILNTATVLFSSFMVIGRLCAGVHWFTDIVGGMFFSFALLLFYKSAVLLLCKE